MQQRLLFFLVVLCCFNLISCKKDGDAPANNLSPENKWILDSMRSYYYYNSQMPEDPRVDLPGTEFFNFLKYPSDRFSIIQDRRGPVEKSIYQKFGFHFLIGLFDSLNKNVGAISFVYPDGAADRVGLKRGDFILKINGSDISSMSPQQIEQRFSGAQVSLTPGYLESGFIKEGQPVNLVSSYFEDRPVVATGAFEKNGIKTGYICYNSFIENFDLDLFNVISGFKNQQVKELIVDLRFNGGGSVASAGKFAVLISGIDFNKHLLFLDGNNVLGDRFMTTQAIVNTSLNPIGINASDYQGKSLNLSKIYFITSNKTASAAELLINILKPYLEVTVIGSSTFGKDMASTVIEDKTNGKIPFRLQPVVYKLYNSLKEGDYINGIAPDIIGDELSVMPLKNMPNSEDPLIAAVLKKIYGSSNVTQLYKKKESGKSESNSRIVDIKYNSQKNFDVPMLLEIK